VTSATLFINPLQYGVLVFRNTSLDDKSHIEFARKFGELDDIKPYLAAGRKNRLAYDELFDVSNVELDGSLVDPESARGQANKVCYLLLTTLPNFPTLTSYRGTASFM
jgi:alpha-ketoglutarate-dependent 2,4-dichlorophenoxyacetate dioxygenase